MNIALACDELICRRDDWNGEGAVRIEGVTAEFACGEFCAVMGPDGCGKGLFLNVLGLLEAPDSGSVRVGPFLVSGEAGEDVRECRNETFGFLFDHPCLLPSFTVAENVAMPLFRICGGDAKSARERTMEVLGFCGIESLECAMTGRLDAAERGLVALARALVHAPDILVAISPPTDLELLALARRAAGELGLCVIWAGPRPELASFAHRILQMREGRIIEDCRV